MINNFDFRVKKNGEPWTITFCTEPHLIENYDLAIADKTYTWKCHHKLEAFFTKAELIKMGRYYNVPPRELVFVQNETQHQKWPHKGHFERVEKSAQKNRGKKRKFSDEHLKHLSEGHKGIKRSLDSRIKQGNTLKGKHYKIIDHKKVYF